MVISCPQPAADTDNTRNSTALGATNSHFVNPHGLHDEAHYTTVYDMYLIFQAALQEEMFMIIYLIYRQQFLFVK